MFVLWFKIEDMLFIYNGERKKSYAPIKEGRMCRERVVAGEQYPVYCSPHYYGDTSYLAVCKTCTLC